MVGLPVGPGVGLLVGPSVGPGADAKVGTAVFGEVLELCGIAVEEPPKPFTGAALGTSSAGLAPGFSPLAVGCEVGPEVSAEVGSEFGPIVGLAVMGEALGRPLSTMAGSVVGIEVMLVGPRVGREVGLTVGLDVCLEVGSLVVGSSKPIATVGPIVAGETATGILLCPAVGPKAGLSAGADVEHTSQHFSSSLSSFSLSQTTSPSRPLNSGLIKVQQDQLVAGEMVSRGSVIGASVGAMGTGEVMKACVAEAFAVGVNVARLSPRSTIISSSHTRQHPSVKSKQIICPMRLPAFRRPRSAQQENASVGRAVIGNNVANVSGLVVPDDAGKLKDSAQIRQQPVSGQATSPTSSSHSASTSTQQLYSVSGLSVADESVPCVSGVLAPSVEAIASFTNSSTGVPSGDSVKIDLTTSCAIPSVPAYRSFTLSSSLKLNSLRVPSLLSWSCLSCRHCS